MDVTAVDALGIKSLFFTLQLEKAATPDDLRALVEPCRQAIGLTARLRQILR